MTPRYSSCPSNISHSSFPSLCFSVSGVQLSVALSSLTTLWSILTFNSEMEGEWEAINKSSSVSKVGNLVDFALTRRANHREFLPLLKKSEVAGKRRQGARKIQGSRIQDGGDFPPTLSIRMTLLMGEAFSDGIVR